MTPSLFLPELLDEAPLTQIVLIYLNCKRCVCASRGFWKRVYFVRAPPFNSDTFPSGYYPKRTITDMLGFCLSVFVLVECGSSALGICPCEYARVTNV